MRNQGKFVVVAKSSFLPGSKHMMTALWYYDIYPQKIDIYEFG